MNRVDRKANKTKNTYHYVDKFGKANRFIINGPICAGKSTFIMNLLDECRDSTSGKASIKPDEYRPTKYERLSELLSLQKCEEKCTLESEECFKSFLYDMPVKCVYKILHSTQQKFFLKYQNLDNLKLYQEHGLIDILAYSFTMHFYIHMNDGMHDFIRIFRPQIQNKLISTGEFTVNHICLMVSPKVLYDRLWYRKSLGDKQYGLEFLEDLYEVYQHLLELPMLVKTPQGKYLDIPLHLCMNVIFFPEVNAQDYYIKLELSETIKEVDPASVDKSIQCLSFEDIHVPINKIAPWLY